MTKLLNKPLKAFSWYALIVLCISIPVYYQVVDFIWLNELDDRNTSSLKHINDSFNRLDDSDLNHSNGIKTLSVLMPNTRLKRVTKITNYAPIFYTTTRDILEDNEIETERFRALKSQIIINNLPYEITIESNVEEADETLLAITTVTFLFFSFLLVGFIILNKNISKKIWLPFRKTLDGLKTFDIQSHKDIAFPSSDIEEFNELNEELETLITRNLKAYLQQKSFIENASHELQTPLAVLKSKLDLLMQTDNLTEEQASLIESVNLPLSRVSRLNKNLLLLAKIENQEFGKIQDEVQLNAAIEHCLELISGYAEEKQIRIVNASNQNLTLKTDALLFESLLNNLIFNAIKYTAPKGEIYINTSNHSITISNSGQKPLDTTTLFKRFSGTSDENSGTGLGLSIVQQICHRYGWMLKYAFEEDFHVFSIQF